MLGLVAVYLLFCVWVGEAFYSPFNSVTVLTQSVIVTAGALGMTLIIVSGGIDLSVGSQIALATVVIARMLEAGASPLAAALTGVLTGALCGLANGFLITRLKLAPFIITLGALLIIRGAATGMANEQKIDAPITWLNALLAKFPDPPWLLVAPGVWVTALLAVVTALALRHTVLGRHTFAIGSNESTARICGVRVERTKLWIYALGGLLTGFAGLMQFSRLTVGDPTAARGMENRHHRGGGDRRRQPLGRRGSVLGSVAGAMLMAVIRNGLSMKGVPNYVQEILTGAIIVAAVALDRWRHRASAR